MVMKTKKSKKMATSNIIDFGPQHKRAILFRRLYICWRNRGIFGTIRWYYRQWRYGPFNEWIFPVIKNMPDKNIIDELISVQPMTGPVSEIIKWENLDSNNPKVGQIFSDGLKNPCCNGCCSPRWYKIWTGTEWISERNITQEEWKSVIAKFHPKQ